MAAQRRVILHRMLTGDWTSTKIVHHCPPGCCDHKPTADILASEVTDALVPHACPIFPRIRWTRSQLAVNWLGLLQNCHGIANAIVGPWLRELGTCSKPVSEADFESASDGSDDLGPAGVQLCDGEQGGDGEVVDGDADEELLVQPSSVGL